MALIGIWGLYIHDVWGILSGQVEFIDYGTEPNVLYFFVLICMEGVFILCGYGIRRLKANDG